MSNLCRKTETTLATEVREFDAWDAKGRRFGARAMIVRVDWEALPEGERYGYLHQTPGTVEFEMRPHAMRGGVSYGAWQSGKRYASEADARTAMAIYFMQAAKRAAKNKARAV